MSDALHDRVLSRINRRLIRLPRLAILNALLFTLFSVPAGLLSMASRPEGGMDGVVYWIIFFWSILLFAHVGLAYVSSGASGRRREEIIFEEVQDAGDTLDLHEDEMIQMHLQLSEAIRKDAWAFRRLLWNALGNLFLWPAMLFIMLLIQRVVPDSSFGSVMGLVFLLALFGTLLLGFMLPVRQLFKRQPADEMARLRGLYGYRRKQKAAPGVEQSTRLVGLGDDGELVVESDPVAASTSNGASAESKST